MYQRLKLCKRGFCAKSIERVCGMSFEALPVWAWSIRLSDWSSIYVSEIDAGRLQKYHTSTWEHLKQKLVIFPGSSGVASLENVDVWFASGSLLFVTNPVSSPAEVAKVVWLSTGSRRKPAKVGEGEAWSWISVSHSRVGGSTSACGMFGTLGVKRLNVQVDPICRYIGHLIKHSERPIPCSLPFEGDHYTVDERLSVHKLDQCIVYQSRFSRTGWGCRSLVDSELAQALICPLI